MRILKRLVPALILAVPLAILPEIAGASIVTPIIVTSTPGTLLLKTYIYNHIILQALAGFWGVSFFALFYYALKMILESYKDEAYTDMSNAIIYALIGFGVISCSMAFATIFTTTGLSTGPISNVNPSFAKPAIDSVRQFIITLSAGIFVLLVVVTGLRMVSTRGDQGNFDKWRKVLIGSIIGVIIMFVADFIIQAVDQRNPLLIVEELKGMALFLLTFAGFLCVLALIIAGIFLIVSIDESLRDRAKKIVIGTLISLAIVICSYAIILTLVPGGNDAFIQ